MSVQNLFLPGRRPKSHRHLYFQLLAVEKVVKMFSQLHFLPYFTPATFFSLPESEIRAGKLLVDPGHLQEELVGGCRHHHYIKACRRRPKVDRALQKNKSIADDHAKKLPEASVSLK